MADSLSYFEWSLSQQVYLLYLQIPASYFLGLWRSRDFYVSPYFPGYSEGEPRLCFPKAICLTSWRREMGLELGGYERLSGLLGWPEKEA